jgi:hypothetical protein
MSIRCYRIDEIKYNKSETFNCWNDEVIWDKLMKDGYLESLNMDGGGQFELSITYIQDEIINNKKLKINEEIKKAFKEDIEFAKKNKEEYVLYSCY